MKPVKIVKAFYYLHTQDKSCWTHELQSTPFATKPSVQGSPLERLLGASRAVFDRRVGRPCPHAV